MSTKQKQASDLKSSSSENNKVEAIVSPLFKVVIRFPDETHSSFSSQKFTRTVQLLLKKK